MEETENKQQREEIFSIVVRAGKRTYFFDVKETRAKEKYLTITESKRRFSNDSAKFFYEKHKLFLYKEDFDKFADGLEGVVNFIRTGQIPAAPEEEIDAEYSPSITETDTQDDKSEDLISPLEYDLPKIDSDETEDEETKL